MKPSVLHGEDVTKNQGRGSVTKSYDKQLLVDYLVEMSNWWDNRLKHNISNTTKLRGTIGGLMVHSSVGQG